MQIVINGSEIGRQRGGNETYINGLVSGFNDLYKAGELSADELSLITCEWETDPPMTHPFKQDNVGRYSQLPFFLWQQSLALRRLHADWYVSNFFLPPLLPFSKTKGAVVVHDLSFYAHPEYYPPFVGWYMRWLTGLAIQQADLVCTVSEFSRNELYRFYPRYQGEVFIVPNGVSDAYRPSQNEADRQNDVAILQKYGVGFPYIFALGNIHPRKNLARLLDAYLLLKERRSDLPKMVWSGHPRWESQELLDKAASAGIVFTGFIDQADLPTFFRQAEMLVYPSLYEGFGLPPVEAMACGTPCVVSNTTSLPEAVANAAIQVDPTDSGAIADGISQLLDDAALYAKLVEAGLARVERLTWSNSAMRLIEAIRAVSPSV